MLILLLLPLCGVAILAGWQAAWARRHLTREGQARIAWITYPALALGLIVWPALRHRPAGVLISAGLYAGILSMSAAFIAATAVARLVPHWRSPVTELPSHPAAAGPAPAPRPWRVWDLAFAWPVWLGATVAMGAAIMIINVDSEGDSESLRPIVFCIAPLLATVAAFAGRGVGPRSRVAITCFTAAGGLGMFVVGFFTLDGVHGASIIAAFVFVVALGLSLAYLLGRGVALIARLAVRGA